MKKLVWILLALAALGGGAYFLRPFWQSFFAPYPERLFPEDTVLYLSIHNIEEARKRFSDTLFAKQLENSPRKTIYQRQLDQAAVLIEDSIGIDPRLFLKQFTRDAALAIFPASGGRGGAFTAYVESESEISRICSFEQQVDPALKRRMPDLQKPKSRKTGLRTISIVDPVSCPGFALLFCFGPSLNHWEFRRSHESAGSSIEWKSESTKEECAF